MSYLDIVRKVFANFVYLKQRLCHHSLPSRPLLRYSRSNKILNPSPTEVHGVSRRRALLRSIVSRCANRCSQVAK